MMRSGTDASDPRKLPSGSREYPARSSGVCARYSPEAVSPASTIHRLSDVDGGAGNLLVVGLPGSGLRVKLQLSLFLGHPSHPFGRTRSSNRRARVARVVRVPRGLVAGPGH